MKCVDVEKFHHHPVDPQGLAHDPQEGGNVIWPGVWRGYFYYGDWHQEDLLVKNKHGKLKVGVCDIKLNIFWRD